MTIEEYLASYCASTNCLSGRTECEVCMYNKGKVDAFNEILNVMKKSPLQDMKLALIKKYIVEQLRGKK